jgi:protein gp37
MSVFYRQDDKSVRPWCKWSWDPITGCENDCESCNAVSKMKKLYAQTHDEGFGSFRPRLWPERFDAPYKTPVPKSNAAGNRNVFLNRLGDLFGSWVEREHVEAILNIVEDTPQWNYIVLTKNPDRCLEFSLPPNIWLGVKIDKQPEVKPAVDFFEAFDRSVRFFCCDPMLEWLQFPTLACVEWLIVGARRKARDKPAFVPPRLWVTSLIRQAEAVGCKVFVKYEKGSDYRRFPGDEDS